MTAHRFPSRPRHLRAAAPWILLALALPLLGTCSDDDGTAPGSGDGDALVGPGGGTVTGTGGAAVTIPAGALDREVVISVAALEDPDQLPAGAAGPLVPVAGVLCGPDGCEFALPVTVTFPAPAALGPGEVIPLHVWQPDSGLWAGTPFVATVGADGTALTATVTHFSFFGGLPGSGPLLAQADALLCDDAAPAAVIAAFEAQFREQIADVGEHGIWDQECRQVVGLGWDLHAESAGGAADDVRLEGRQGDGATMVSYPVECLAGDGVGNTLDAMVTIHHECALPTLAVAADPARIEPGESSTVTATLHCDQLVMDGQVVMFECFGSGPIAPDEAATSPAGQAQTMYTNDGDPEPATVRAYHDACAGTDQAATVTAEATIAVGGDWQGTLSVDFTQQVGGGPLGTFADHVTVTFDFTVEAGTVAGDGTLTHAVQITPGDQDCWLGGVSAPPFGVVVAGTASGGQVTLQIAPEGAMPLSFEILCDPDDPSSYPYPGHGLLEGMALTQDIQPAMALEDGASDSGSGSQDFGGDIPLTYTWSCSIGRAGR